MIASNTGGMSELVINNLTGLLTPVQDPALIAKAIDELASDRRKRETLSTNAYMQATDYFTCDKMIQAVKNIYA